MDRMLAAVALIALLGAEEAHTRDFEFGHRPARQALVDSDRANGSQEVSDSLSMAEGLTATGKRVANKLAVVLSLGVSLAEPWPSLPLPVGAQEMPSELPEFTLLSTTGGSGTQLEPRWG